MNNLVKNALIFVGGVATGGVASWFIFKKHYESVLTEEVEYVKQHYHEKLEEVMESMEYDEDLDKMAEEITDMAMNGADEEELEEAITRSKEMIDGKRASYRKVNKPSISEIREDLEKRAKELGYTPDEDEDPADSESPSEYDETSKTGDYPYIIEPSDFGSIEDYGQQTLIYYTDGYLADADTDELLDDAEEKVGWENLDEIGKYEEDALHICNDEYECYYEILRSDKKYKERYE